MRTAYSKRICGLLTVLFSIVTLWGVALSQDDLKAGIEAYKKGDHDQAIYHLNQHLSQSPRDYDANFYLGNAYFQKEDWKQAERSYRKAYQRKPKPEVIYQLGLTYLNLGELDKAASYAEEGVKEKGTKHEKAKLYYLLAMVHYERKNYTEADVNIRHAIAAEKNNASYHKLLGDINYERDVASLAIKEYEKALDLDPSLAQELHYKMGRAYFQTRQFNEALEQFKLTIRVDSSFAEAYLALGNLYYWGNRFSEALWAYEQYLNLSPGAPEVFFNLGKMYFSAGQYQKAAEYLSKTVAETENTEAYYLLGQSHQELNDYPQAEGYYARYETLREANPEQEWSKEDAEFWFKRGVANYNIGDSAAMEISEKSLSYAIGLDPHISEAYTYLGLCCYKQKDFDRAIELFNQKILIDPASYNTYVNLGYSYLEVEKPDSALIAFEKSIAIKPDNLKALSQIAWIYLSEKKDYKKAGEFYRKIIQFDSTDCEAHGYVGLSLLMQKKNAVAVRPLRKAVTCLPGHEQFNLWLAQAYALTGQKESARTYYAKVLKINPQNKQAQEGLEILEF
jgi:tetratricopeptide (TPR) repeat protein